MSLQELEFFYDNPVKFKEIIPHIKGIHNGNYNRTALLNVWRKLTRGLKESYGPCETNIKCLLHHNIEFLNYHYDNEPMVQLLTYGTSELIDTVVSGFPIEKLIGFQNKHEPKLSLAQDININCPVMNGLELLRNKGESAKKKMDILLKYTSLQFTLKYVSNHTLYFTTPLVYMMREPDMVEYIKLHGGTLDYILNEPLCCEKSYYQFFKAEAVHMPLLKYLKQTSPQVYAMIHKRRTRKMTPFRKRTMKSIPNHPYVVVGGVGGSGTRMIASILATLGLNIGTDLNEAYDNLSYTLLFKREQTLDMDNKAFEESYRILENSILGTQHYLTTQDKHRLETLCERGRPGHPQAWLRERARNILVMNEQGPLENPYLKELPQLRHKPLAGKWGWKEPNSHVMMNRLMQQKHTKFIMVVRNGLDMAFSTNQNQLRLWGPTILPKEMRTFDKHGHILYTPRVSMKYWTLVHQKLIRESKAFGEQFLFINFDDMCIHPEKWLPILCNFLNVDSSLIPEIRPLVVYQSDGIGRFRKHDLSQFDPSDVLFAKQLGFETV
jgi:hypothetical protein